MNENIDESFWAKGLRKCRNEPFVPIGAVATTIFLGLGLRSLQNGNKKSSQIMMRARIAAQVFTVVAMGVGAYLNSQKPQVKSLTLEEKLLEMGSAKDDNTQV